MDPPILQHAGIWTLSERQDRCEARKALHSRTANPGQVGPLRRVTLIMFDRKRMATTVEVRVSERSRVPCQIGVAGSSGSVLVWVDRPREFTRSGPVMTSRHSARGGVARRAGVHERSQSFDLRRFHEAQAETIGQVRRELTRGKKESHWIWYTFPQHVHLGKSTTSCFYGIKGLPEAIAYLNDPSLSQRLLDAVNMIMANRLRMLTAQDIFESDAVKVKSCLTLFESAAGQSGKHALEEAMYLAIARFFPSGRDQTTLAYLAAE